MKKIISSLAIIAAVSAVVIGGTTAFFTDTEISANNVFTAGSVTLDLTSVGHVYGGSDQGNAPSFTWMPNQGRFALDDLKPLDTGMLDIALENGANEAHICAMITGNPADLVEAEDIALYDQLNFWVDGTGEQVTPGDWFDLGVTGANSPAGTAVEYCFGDANVDATGLVSCDYGNGDIPYNDAQNGSFSADLMFYAIQTRNNEGFSCDQLTLVNDVPVYIPEQPLNDPVTVNIDEQYSLPAVITVEDLGDSIKWTMDMDENDADFANGHAAYGLVISNDGVEPAFQIHSNDGSCGAYPFGTHLYSPWDDTVSGNYNGWMTGDDTTTYNTDVATLSWVSATGERDLSTNTDAVYTVTIDKSELSSTFYWGVALMGNTSDTQYPSSWAKWTGNASGLQSYIQ